MNRRGFTLIELLVVIAILAVLAGMALPILAFASRSAKRQASLATMNKVTTALRLFRAEVGSHPWQAAYADPASGAAPGNELLRRLGGGLTAAAIRDLHAEADAAAAVYAYDCTDPANPTGDPVERPAANAHVFRASDVKPASGAFQAGGGAVWNWDGKAATWTPKWPAGGWYNSLADLQVSTAVMLNRLAAERVRLAVFAGNPRVHGCRIAPTLRPDGTVFQAGRDNSGAALLSDPVTAARPGWCGDYLDGLLEPASVAGEAILDAWRRPLVYVCQVVEGTRAPSNGVVFLVPTLQIDAQAYGLATLGRATTTRAASDRRTTAAAGWEHACEVWSAGPDGRFAWERAELGNADNIAPERYDAGLAR